MKTKGKKKKGKVADHERKDLGERKMTDKEVAQFQDIVAKVGRRDMKGIVVIFHESKDGKGAEGIVFANEMSPAIPLRALTQDNPMALLALMGGMAN